MIPRCDNCNIWEPDTEGQSKGTMGWCLCWGFKVRAWGGCRDWRAKDERV